MLDGFEMLPIVSGAITMSVTKNGVSFSKAIIEKLRKPNQVQLLVNRNSQCLAIVPCESEDEDSRPFYKQGTSVTNGVRWSAADVRESIAEIAGWNLEETGYKVVGKYQAEDNAVVFDLTQANEL